MPGFNPGGASSGNLGVGGNTSAPGGVAPGGFSGISEIRDFQTPTPPSLSDRIGRGFGTGVLSLIPGGLQARSFLESRELRGPSEIASDVAQTGMLSAGQFGGADQQILPPQSVIANPRVLPDFASITPTDPSETFLRGGRDFSKPSDLSQFAFEDFDVSTPGGQFQLGPEGAAFKPSPLFRDIRRQGRQRATQAANLLEQEAAKFSLQPLTSATKQRFNMARDRLRSTETQAVSNVTEQLASAKLIGSSFAANALSSTSAEFALQTTALDAQENEALASAQLQEIQQRINLNTQASNIRLQQARNEITDIFGQTELATQLSAQFGELFADNLRAQLQAEVAESDSIRKTLASLEAERISAEAALKRTQIQAASGQRISEENREAEGFSGFGSLIGSLLTAPSTSLLGRIF